jgi:hypothetical protein
VKKLFSASLICLSLVAGNTHGADRHTSSNPFIEAMIRMMQIFGLIDSTRWPLTTPYLPGSGLGGMPGVGGLSALGGYPAMSSMYGMSAVPGLGGMTGLPGMSGIPGAQGMQGLSGMPQAFPPGLGQMPGWPSPQAAGADQTRLDGIWELNKGGFVIIKGRHARLYLSREKFQDFIVGFDNTNLWWVPQNGGTQSRYRYRMQDDRMILADDKGGYLLLRRRR